MPSRTQFGIGAFAIIKDHKNRVLLCHRRDHNLWNLPGGKVESGETPWDAVFREIKEETGLKVKIQKLIGVYSKPYKNEIIFCFACGVTSGKIKITAEADQIKFFARDKLPNNFSRKQLERVKDSFRNNRVVFKIQRGPSSIELFK